MKVKMTDRIAGNCDKNWVFFLLFFIDEFTNYVSTCCYATTFLGN